jgi:hypothetical protein
MEIWNKCNFYTMIIPESTLMRSPVMPEFLAANTKVMAISSGVVILFNFAMSKYPCLCSSVKSVVLSVFTRPGQTAFTLIFGPCVSARHLLRCSPAALQTEYAILLPFVKSPPTEDWIKNTPPSGLALKCGRAARSRKTLDLTRRFQVWSQSASVRASMSPNGAILVFPYAHNLVIVSGLWIVALTALLTTMSRPPSPLTASSMILLHSGTRDSSL